MFGTSRLGGIAAYFAACFLMLPLFAVIPFAFTAKRYLSLPDGEWSLGHFRTLVEDGTWLSSIGNSLAIAGLSSLLATILATAFCLGLWYRQPRLAAFLTGLTLLPMVVPPVTSAIIIYFLLAKLGLLDTIIGLVIAHTIMSVPFSVLVILSATAKLERSLDRAARNLGATLLQSIFRVLIPNLWPGILSAWFLAFMLSWEETTVTLFTSGVEVVTLPKRIWDNLRLDVDPVIAAISLIMVAATLLVIIGRLFFRSKRSLIG